MFSFLAKGCIFVDFAWALRNCCASILPSFPLQGLRIVCCVFGNYQNPNENCSLRSKVMAHAYCWNPVGLLFEPFSTMHWRHRVYRDWQEFEGVTTFLSPQIYWKLKIRKNPFLKRKIMKSLAFCKQK